MYYLHAMPRTLSAFYIYRMIAPHICNNRTKIDIVSEYTSPLCRGHAKDVYFVIIQAITVSSPNWRYSERLGGL
jgi:hypothetical protein